MIVSNHGGRQLDGVPSTVSHSEYLQGTSCVLCFYKLVCMLNKTSKQTSLTFRHTSHYGICTVMPHLTLWYMYYNATPHIMVYML